ncbi:MAG: NAD-dependent epimerase/dehydratase family protein [Actinomycetota bacterium]|nr:NAD-dependent epimerase/dehydratase family protein [Actinomycetota bacterium]
MGRRILVTGLDTFWGGRVAQALEARPDVDVVLGLGTGSPSVALDRTEYVRSDQTYSILSRIVRAAKVDTIVHTFLIVDSTSMNARTLHELNVIGTMNLLAAAGSADTPVRQVIVKSSTMVYGCSARDPTFFTEEMEGPSLQRTRLERSLLDVEALLRDFADDNPSTVVTLLRFANVIGEEISTPITRNLSRSLVPSVLGFDPLFQFVHETDVVRCLEFVTMQQRPGIYNVAGRGRMPWSEVVAMVGTKRLLLPPVATRLAALPLIRAGLIDLPPEMECLLRYGRGVDTSRLESAGFEHNFTSAGAVDSFARATRLKRAVGTTKPSYTYEADVEAFFRHSPTVAANDRSGKD